MKTVLCMLTLAALAGCYSHKEVQVKMVNTELIRIDTVYRHNDQVQQLIWRSNENIEYVSFVSLGKKYFIGTQMTMLKPR
jgi:hypothetical protein